MPTVLPALFQSKKFVVLLLTVVSVAFLTWSKTVTPAEAIHLLSYVLPTYFVAQGLADLGKGQAEATEEANAKVLDAFDPPVPESLTGPETSDMKVVPMMSTEEAPPTKPEEEITKPEVDPFPGTTAPAADAKKKES